MEKRKEIKKGFFFSFGGKNDFGEERDLTKPLTVDFTSCKGCGISLISNKHINFKEREKLKLNITNHSDEDIFFRIEKKFLNATIPILKHIDKNNSCSITLFFSDLDKEMRELVVAILQEDNKNREYSISIEVE